MQRIGSGAGAVALGVVLAGAIAGAATDRAAAQLNIAVEARATLLARAYNASGQQLFAQVAGKPGNIVFSPYSIGTAMTMALTGARGDTASEMARVLMQRMAREAIDTANAEMIAILKGYDHSGDPPVCPPSAKVKAGTCEGPLMGDGKQCYYGMRLEGKSCVGEGTPAVSAKLLTANALMLLKRGDLISEDYAETLKIRYGAEVFRQASLDDINSWVSRNTEGKIAKLIDQLDDNAAAVLLNAVYFKARWASPFDKKLTKDDTFNLSRSQKVQVPLMNEAGHFSLVSRGGYRAIRLPYQIPEIGMVVVLPDDIEGVGDVARRLGPNELADLFAALRNGQARKPVTLALPRFKAEYKADLVPAFEAAGMHKPFDATAADFSGMTSRPVPPGTVFIGQIAHRAVIDVSEETTEAAAATGAVMATASAQPVPQPPEPFRVDRPFLFYLVDDASGAILFEGRIADPR
jgi:serpin B